MFLLPLGSFEACRSQCGGENLGLEEERRAVLQMPGNSLGGGRNLQVDFTTKQNPLTLPLTKHHLALLKQGRFRGAFW